MSSPKLPAPVVAAIDAASILGIRAGRRSDHRFIGIWPVVVEGRVFGRSWSQAPDGWFQAFVEDPFGTMQVGKREVRIRVTRVRSERLRDLVERAYAEKYATPGSRRYVRGFRSKRRRDTTIEFKPR